MTALGFAQQSVGVLMQCSELLFTLLTLVAELKELGYYHSQTCVFAQLSLPLLPTVHFLRSEGRVSFWHFRKCVLC
ncbi:hypothetical protein M405DRAFT_828950 [Rhizopogon salebrosus TDB-379]|nr:hypothetical protein M405DRAFT_828950 [Rhizopogon salebrosus TDB-379]